MASQNPAQPVTDRRDRARKEVKQLIEERNQVLSLYYSLVKQVENFDDSGNTHELLQEFCQELVDYLAAGHFELYRRIEEGNERRDDIKKLSTEVMPKITLTTQVAVAFNDLFDKDNEDNHNNEIEQLPAHLTKLGEHLATRIDLEDKIINALLASSSRPDLRAVNL